MSKTPVAITRTGSRNWGDGLDVDAQMSMIKGAPATGTGLRYDGRVANAPK
jgi:hypothetical protein